MPEPEQSGLSLKWEVLALWFGRGLFLIALWQVQQIIEKVDSLARAQTIQANAISQMTEELHSRTALRWTQVDQRLWATLLAQQNPRIIVPDPKHVELPGEAVR